MEERMKILEMLAAGTINSEEANQLLSTLDKQKLVVESESGIEEKNMGKFIKEGMGKVLYIRVKSADGDKVSVNIPLAFIKAAMKAGNANAILNQSMKGNLAETIDPEIILSSIESGFVGKIVDVKSADGDDVEIYIE
jgi:citrate lyase gamma subunit